MAYLVGGLQEVAFQVQDAFLACQEEVPVPSLAVDVKAVVVAFLVEGHRILEAAN